MKEERLAVLDMLAKGSINVDEAERLLKLLNKEEKPRRERSGEWSDRLNRFGKKVGHVARQVGDKLEDTATVMEPKIRKTAQTVADKTQDAAWAVADKTHDVVLDIKKNYNDYRAEKKQAQPRSGDEPVQDDDFEELPKGSTIIGMENIQVSSEAPKAEEAKAAEPKAEAPIEGEARDAEEAPAGDIPSADSESFEEEKH